MSALSIVSLCVFYGLIATVVAARLAAIFAWKNARSWNNSEPDVWNWFTAWVSAMIVAILFSIPTAIILAFQDKLMPLPPDVKAKQMVKENKRLRKQVEEDNEALDKLLRKIE